MFFNRKPKQERPVTISWTQSTVNDLFTIDFTDFVGIISLMVVTPTTAVSVSIYGSEYSLGGSAVNAVNVFGTQILAGTPTILEVKNRIILTNSRPIHYFWQYPYYTRFLNLNSSVTGNTQVIASVCV